MTGHNKQIHTTYSCHPRQILPRINKIVNAANHGKFIAPLFCPIEKISALSTHTRGVAAQHTQHTHAMHEEQEKFNDLESTEQKQTSLEDEPLAAPRRQVRLIAPGNFPDGYRLEVTTGKDTFSVNLPRGGVARGESFEAMEIPVARPPLPKDGVLGVTVSSTSSRPGFVVWLLSAHALPMLPFWKVWA